MEGRGLSDLADRAAGIARAAAGAAGDAAARVALTRRRARLATELGELVYRQRNGEAALDTQIDRRVEEMQAVSAEVAVLVR